MAKRGIILSSISILLLATLFFFASYFFFPSVSMQFFGVSFRPIAASGNVLDDKIDKGLENILSSQAVKDAISATGEVTEETKEKLISYLKSDEGKRLKSELKDFATSSADEIKEFFTSGKGQEVLSDVREGLEAAK